MCRLSAGCPASQGDRPELLAFDRRLKGEVDVGERLHVREPRGAHGGVEPAMIAERDLCLQQGVQRGGGGERPAIEAGEDLIERFERPGHLEVGELRAQVIAP
ncbi:MAG: hypothetical protein H0X64_06260 [Gemmatimonadaceae bacterium]|nr:hypothetical protein [Gemmatimonadaceae bacterium]